MMKSKQKCKKKTVQLKKQKMAKWKSMIVGTVQVVLTCTLVYSAWKLMDYYTTMDQAGKDFKALRNQIDSDNTDTDLEEKILAKYAEIHEQNSDFVGWIQLENTPINYPIMQTPKVPQYYLRRNFKKEYSIAGTPFLDVRSDMERGNNLIIYSHNMNNGSMFGVLQKYLEEDFGKSQSDFICDSLTERRIFELAAVLHFEDSEKAFEAYYQVPQTEADFNTYVTSLQEAAVYCTDVPIVWGDQLMTLSTCDKRDSHYRILVVTVEK